jgi:hypothetical protein
MRLTWVRFSSLMKMEDGTSTDEIRMESVGPIEFNASDQTISFGHMVVPMSQIRFMVRITEAECPECHETFANTTAAAAHRRFSHGVLGKRAQAQKDAQ